MKIKFIKKFLWLFALSAIIISCEVDDQTGASELTPSAPSIAINLDYTDATSLIEDDSTFEYTVTLSETQIVDTKLHVTQIDGTASTDDYEMTGTITIPAGYTSAKGSIKILSDDLIEETETLTIQIGSITTANATLTPITIDFTILNFEDGDLSIDMEWAITTSTDHEGNEYGPTEFADLRLLISTTPDNDKNNFVGVSDGGSFEHFVLSGSEPDGDYYVVADFYDAPIHYSRDLDLNVIFTQIGVETSSQEFPAVLNSGNSCSTVYYVLSKITKTGTTYTMESVNTPSLAIPDIAAFAGTWSGTTSFGHPTQVVTTLNGSGQLEITGIGIGWMENEWGEVITDMVTLVMDIDLGTGDFVIAESYYMTTTWNGAPQPTYSLSATGSLNACTGEMHLDYDFVQGGTSFTSELGEVYIEDITIN